MQESDFCIQDDCINFKREFDLELDFEPVITCRVPIENCRTIISFEKNPCLPYLDKLEITTRNSLQKCPTMLLIYLFIYLLLYLHIYLYLIYHHHDITFLWILCFIFEFKGKNCWISNWSILLQVGVVWLTDLQCN